MGAVTQIHWRMESGTGALRRYDIGQGGDRNTGLGDVEFSCGER